MTSKELIINHIEQCKTVLKELYILELLKNTIEIVENTKDTVGPRYYIKIRQDVFIDDESKKLIK